MLLTTLSFEINDLSDAVLALGRALFKSSSILLINAIHEAYFFLLLILDTIFGPLSQLEMYFKLPLIISIIFIS